MPASIQLVRSEMSHTLRLMAAQESKQRRQRRLLAVANVLDGMNRSEAALSAGINRQSLRTWIKRYNDFGLDGLADEPRCGRPRFLTAEQREELAVAMLRGPKPETDPHKRWKIKELCRFVEKRFGVIYTTSGMMRLKRTMMIASGTPLTASYSAQSAEVVHPTH